VPGKFPEAYMKTIEELQRRKAYNIATEGILQQLKKIFKYEFNKR
jgi:hypothetical protein